MLIYERSRRDPYSCTSVSEVQLYQLSVSEVVQLYWLSVSEVV